MIFICLFFHVDFKDTIKYTAILSKFFYTFYERHFSRVRHPSLPGRGHGSLTCHMNQFERSDWLRSENFINIMIEYTTNLGQTWDSNYPCFMHGPLTNYVKLSVAHAPGMPGTFSPPPRISDPEMHDARAGMIANLRFPLKTVAGKTLPAFQAHAHPAILRIW